MPSQDYATHRHNPKLSAIGFLFLLVSVVAFALRWFEIGGRYTTALGLLGLIASIQVLLSISRVYTTRLQDRIIKLEMHVRGMKLLTPAQQAVLARLSKPQIIALRFASDGELPALVEQADRENMTAEQIKRAIKNWVPDWDRT
jgi:Family of unknown function (DUF6526)